MKIRCHLPKSLLGGTVPIVIKNLSTDNRAQDIVDALQAEGVEIMELYMFKNSRGQLTGTVKATVKGSSKVKEWLEKGKGEINGARVLVERQRTPMTCFNCNAIGHRAAECKETKKCKMCGEAGHLKAECAANPEEQATKCQYCFEEGHRRGECQKKRDAEREERKNYRKEKADPVIENPWNKMPANEKASEHEKDSLEDLKAEMTAQMQEEMKRLQQEMKEMMMEEMKKMMKEMTTNMMNQMKETMKEIMKETLKQQHQWQDQQRQQHQQQQLSSLDRSSALKRSLTSPKEQKGERKKVQEQEEGERRNLDEEMHGVKPDTEENEGEKEKRKKEEPKKGKGGGASKKK